MIDPETIGGILERTNLVELIQETLNLKKAGSEWRAKCPFHVENSPSFYVIQKGGRQFFYCFGCGAGGDAIKWSREMLGLTFGEALELLATRVGLPIPQEKLSPEEQEARRIKRAGHEALERQQDYCVEFYGGSPAQDEADRRGIPRELQQAYGLGFCIGLAPDIEEMIALEAGIIKIREHGERRGERVCPQQDRWTFPVRNPQGRTLGWSGRTLLTDEQIKKLGYHVPKYLNTRQTRWFDKSRVMFGIDLATRAIARADEAVLVEGNVDVIMAAAQGIPNTVAVLGTGFSNDHARVLNRLADRVTICFDPDQAGTRASDRAAMILHEHELRTRLVELEPGQDPAETSDLKRRVDESKDYFQARWDQTQGLEPAERAASRNRLQEAVSTLPEGHYREAVQESLDGQGAKLILGRPRYRAAVRRETRDDTTMAMLRSIQTSIQMQELDPREFQGTVVEEALRNRRWLDSPSPELAPYCAEILARPSPTLDSEYFERALEQWRREQVGRLFALDNEELDPGKRLDLLTQAREILIRLSE